MPNYRSITIAFRSQYDISMIPEFDPPDPELTNARSFSNTPYVSSAPKAVDGTTSTVSVYIPIYPSSQFWICYDISPPAPPAAHFLFKLFINGAHVVSWSCGQEDGRKGKTIFGLFESPENREGKKFVERRSLFFSDVKKSVGVILLHIWRLGCIGRTGGRELQDSWRILRKHSMLCTEGVLSK